MSLKKQFEKACRTVATRIESGELKCGKYSTAGGFKKDQPHCAIGWVAAETGVHPNLAYDLFEHFNIAPTPVTNPNDNGSEEEVVVALRKIASKLHG